MVAFLLGGKHYPPGTRLAGGFALLGHLDTVVDRVAHQVHQRIGQGFDQVLVEIGFFTDELKVDLFLQAASQVADQAREATEDLLDRLHAGLHHRTLQIGRHHVEVGDGLGHRLVAAVGAQAYQTVTHQHQLADHVHDLVQACGIDAHGGLGLGRRLFRRSSSGRLAHRSCRSGLGRSSSRGGLGRRFDRHSRSRFSRSLDDRRLELALAMQLIEQCFELVVGDLVSCTSCTTALCRFGACRRSGFSRGRFELALAMQLVQQGFKFVIGDFVTGRRSNELALGRHRGTRSGRELSLAMQLVEQRLEFVVGNLVGGRASRYFGRSRLAGGRLNGIEHQFEFAIGALGSGFGHDLRFDCRRWLISRGWLRQTCQRRKQLTRGWRRLDALADLTEHRVHGVERLQNDIHQFGIDSTLTLAQDVEDVFGDMAALHQLMQLEEPGTALDRMEPAKNRIEQRHVIGAAFQLHELLGQ